MGRDAGAWNLESTVLLEPLELEWYIRYHGILNKEIVEEVWNLCNAKFADYLKKLGEVVGMEICTSEDIKEALGKRMVFYTEMGCRTVSCGHAHNRSPPLV